MKKISAVLEEKKKQKGFTLIELIVVMAILGLLATVGLGSFRSAQIKGRDAQRKHDLGQLQRGLEAYYNDKGEYPLTGELPALGSWQDVLPGGGTGTLYMKEIPTDPTAYKYFYESDKTSYKIFAHLENEKDKDILDCTSVTDEKCNESGTVGCNYGVSSANLDICD